ncbi:WD repeat domain phosphoinositide-interacting protein 2 isoform X2 [Copidosoma floridanum]|uniref:WD repeat domain phosphoinositide-interacting protein 2 isoform X2 n=1 Tax=Copidosoma floridanum TaxID=29053 RepID=UPI0006C96794|nr:WD repeat domain phosphoinositide-interacting protein 2 isoform X2 [Copidosoma floridanum]
MSLTDEHAEPENNALFVNFNQDYTSLAVGDKEGYRVFSLLKVDDIDNIYEAAEEAYIFERLFNSSLIAIVNTSSPRKLRVCHFKKGTEICSYSYSNTVLSVRLNRKRLVVCLEENIFIHNIRDMQIAHLIRDTPPNPKGVFALSTSEPCYLAYPGSSTIGEVQIFDAENLQAKTMIPAHNSPLVALAFDTKGAKLATASEKGTVIRVFQVSDGAKLFEFRRGVKRCVSISSLSFSVDSVFLCVSSNTETVHVFKVKVSQDDDAKSGQEDESWIGYFSMALTASASYLPSQVTGVFTQGRAFATIHLPFQGLKNICAIAVIEKVPRLLVASEDGYLYIYNFDAEDGVNNVLYKQHRLFRRTEGNDSTTPASRSAGGTTPPIVIPGSHKTACINSYAGALRGRSPNTMSESEKYREIVAATESPPKPSEAYRLDDDAEFPPVTTSPSQRTAD